MGPSISEKQVFEHVLEQLNIIDYRDPFKDHQVKELTSGAAIALMVEAQLRDHDDLSDIEENLRARPEWQKLLGIHPIVGSTLYRKMPKLPIEKLQQLALRLLQEVEDGYTSEPSMRSWGPLHIIDGSEIVLPPLRGKWAYTQKHKNAIKLHLKYVVLNEQSAYADDLNLSTGAVSDKEGADSLIIDPDATYIFDRGYLHFHRYHQWDQKGIRFVARVNANTKGTTLATRDPGEDILKDADIEVTDATDGQPFRLRLVEFTDEQGRLYRLFTNRWDVSAQEIAEMYRQRWAIELFFKWMKQHLHVVKFYNYQEEAVWAQVYTAIIAYALTERLKKETDTNKSKWALLKKLRHYWFHQWQHFIEFLHQKPKRTSKGRRKKGKPGRPRKHPKKYKSKKVIVQLS